jgi:hypothetical protein
VNEAAASKHVAEEPPQRPERVRTAARQSNDASGLAGSALA